MHGKQKYSADWVIVQAFGCEWQCAVAERSGQADLSSTAWYSNGNRSSRRKICVLHRSVCFCVIGSLLADKRASHVLYVV